MIIDRVTSNYIVLWGGAGLAVGLATGWMARRLTSWRPVGLPLVSASTWAAVGAVGGGAAALLLGWWCACLTCTDLATRRLPNALTYTGAVGMLVYATVVGDLSAGIVGGGVLCACYLAVHVASPRAFGAGDVKLAFTSGGLTGLAGDQAWMSAALLAPVLTGVVGLTYLALGRPQWTVPHGPSMCLATLLALAAAST